MTSGRRYKRLPKKAEKGKGEKGIVKFKKIP